MTAFIVQTREPNNMHKQRNMTKSNIQTTNRDITTNPTPSESATENRYT